MSCGNSMCSICFAARSWAVDNNGKMPSDFLSMSNELATPRVLICDADRSRRAAPNWASFTPDLSSYEIVASDLREGDPNRVFLRCKIHKDHIGYADGQLLMDSETNEISLHLAQLGGLSGLAGRVLFGVFGLARPRPAHIAQRHSTHAHRCCHRMYKPNSVSTHSPTFPKAALTTRSRLDKRLFILGRVAHRKLAAVNSQQSAVAGKRLPDA